MLCSSREVGTRLWPSFAGAALVDQGGAGSGFGVFQSGTQLRGPCAYIPWEQCCRVCAGCAGLRCGTKQQRVEQAEG